MDRFFGTTALRYVALSALLCLPLLHCSKDTSVNVAGECTEDENCIDDGNPCTLEICDEGSCTHPHATNQTACGDGLCYEGICCKGCWDGTICKDGADIKECGLGGAACTTCDDGETCTTDTCDDGVCANTPTNEAGACPGGACRDGVCCGGCWDGTSCKNGQSEADACGLSGDACVACPTTDECEAPTCTKGICGVETAQDGTTCTDGQCRDGACCQGCWDDTGNTCAAGTGVDACGAAGAMCESCDDSNDCTEETCSSGACTTPTPLDGTACSQGVCVTGTCQACGELGEACCESDSCNGGLQCIGGSCGGCGATTQPCCPNDSCQTDNVCRNGNCVACGGNNERCCEGSTCGANLICNGSDFCTPCGGAGQPCCTGDSCGSNLVCESGTCAACGGLNEPCCDTGSACESAELACNSGSCEHCGERGEVCCASSTCATWANCESNACEGCGHAGEPCCSSGDACDAYGTCGSSGCEGCGLQIEPGNDHLCALRSDATVWCWGSNGTGQLGNGGTAGSSAPVQVSISGGGAVSQVVTGTGRSCARKQDGTVWCWGLTSLSPVQVSPGGSGAVADIAAGGNQVCARKADNTLWCWTTGAPAEVVLPGSRTPTKISVGEHHACAVANDQTLWCWGSNDRGQLGNGSVNPSATPVQVTWLSGTVLVSGVAAGGSHTCAWATDKKLWCWGDNQYGQLGRGTTSSQPAVSPDEVSPLGTTVMSATVGTSFTCALKDDDTVWCFGANVSGQLGDGLTTQQPSPVQATDLGASVEAVAAGAAKTCVLRTGSFWCTSKPNSQPPVVDVIPLPCP